MAQRDDPWVLRTAVSAARDEYLAGRRGPHVRTVIRSSWERSHVHLPPERAEAPVEDHDLAQEWAASPLSRAVQRMLPSLTRLTADGDLVVAVTDPDGKILWSHSDRWMRRRAERVNFVPGGRWDESSMGTNALDLALRTGRSQTVFSAEHYTAAVQDWVCYSAPIFDASGVRLLGVFDLSTTWNRALTVGMRLVEVTAAHLSEMADHPGAGEDLLTVRALGGRTVLRGQTEIRLPPRQLEILAILAMHPQGLSLDALHANLYPDLRVSPTTCKAEVSRLRHALGGGIASNPYRLELPVVADHVEIVRLLRHGRVSEAVRLFGGELLAGSEAPALVEQRHLVTTALREAVLDSGDPDLLVALGDRLPQDLEVHERALAALAETDPRRGLVEARRRLAAR